MLRSWTGDLAECWRFDSPLRCLHLLRNKSPSFYLGVSRSFILGASMKQAVPLENLDMT